MLETMALDPWRVMLVFRFLDSGDAVGVGMVYAGFEGWEGDEFLPLGLRIVYDDS